MTIHPTAVIDAGALIGEGTSVWHFSHVMPGARIGARCSLGQNVFVAGTVRVGDHVRIQNNVSLYDGVELDDEVFCGPSCVFTNVRNPRSEVPRSGVYEPTRIGRGATIGANATVVCGSTIGRYAFIAAGAVVSKGTIPDYALIVGVPGRQRGWVGRHGEPLLPPDGAGIMKCPVSGFRYREIESGIVRCLDLDEDMPLPLR